MTVSDVPWTPIELLLGAFGLCPVVQPAGEAITASYWGGEEAGIVGCKVYVRRDTPVHSLLHESCHTICMTAERRRGLDRDAGGDDLEETAVCYLQVVLADELEAVGRERLLRDMDRWGYSFRLGGAAKWFAEDADDARKWLIEKELLTNDGRPTFRLRG